MLVTNTTSPLASPSTTSTTTPSATTTISTAHIELLIYDQWQHIYNYLSIKDLSALACTSKQISQQVESHWLYQSKLHCMENVIQEYLINQLLLKEERKTKDILSRGDYTYRWLYVNGARMRRTFRLPVAKICYNVIGTPLLICFQFFHTFPQVLPGLYKVKLKIKKCQLRWLACEYPIIKISWTNTSGHHEVTSKMPRKKLKEIDKVFKGKSLKINDSFSFNYDVKRQWYDFSLDKLILDRMSDVTFEFEHFVNNKYKTRVFLDYVEVIPIEESYTKSKSRRKCNLSSFFT